MYFSFHFLITSIAIWVFSQNVKTKISENSAASQQTENSVDPNQNAPLEHSD